MLEVSVPATLSNLGPGYDVLGLSVGWFNTFRFTFEPGWAAEGIPVDPVTHLTLHTARAAADRFGLPLGGLQVWQQEQVPRARGLGSSATARVAGLLAALSVRPDPPSIQDQLEFLAEAEGHPDNVVPALVGGLNMIVRDGDGRLQTLRFPPPRLRVALCVPEVEVSTAEARALLPAAVPHGDAVFQAGRMAFLVVGLREGHLGALSLGIEDRLHQRWRAPLIGPVEEVFARARGAGAVAPFVSGSGSTLAAFVPEGVDAARVAEAMCGPFRERGIVARGHAVDAVERGALPAA